MREFIRQETVNNEEQFRGFLDTLETRLEELRTRISQLEYERMSTKRARPELRELRKSLAETMREPRLEELISVYRDKVTDERLTRRTELWHRMVRHQKVEGDSEVAKLGGELSDLIMTYDYPLAHNPEGTIADVRHVLRTETKRELRKQAWACTEELAVKLRGRMHALHHRRNEVARALGYANYADYSLDKEGTGLELCLNLLKELNAATQKEYAQLLQERADRFGIDQIEPWDTQFLLDGGIDLPERYFPKSRITERLKDFSYLHGVPMDKLGVTPEYFDIPWNGVCMTVNSRKDARIICNPRDGYTYYRTMFHELGHGLHAVLNEQPEPIFAAEPSPSAEGIAETFGYFTRNPQWLLAIGIPEEELGKIMRALLAPWFFYLRQRGAFALFGLEVYMNPDRDLDQLLGEIESEVTGVRADSTPRWTANAWYVAGATWHNYIVADMVASQLHRGLRQRFGEPYGNPEAIDFLRERYLALGAAVEWRDKLKDISGEDLGVDALVGDLKRMARSE